MAIPDFDVYGLLPVGVYDCTLEEIKTRFGSFKNTDRRLDLFQKLQHLIDRLLREHFALSLLIDGSFVTAALEPNDIDLVLVLPLAHDMSADLFPMQYNLVSKRWVQKHYGFDIVVVRENTAEYDEAVAFFQQVRRNPALRKGILRLIL